MSQSNMYPLRVDTRASFASGGMGDTPLKRWAVAARLATACAHTSYHDGTYTRSRQALTRLAEARYNVREDRSTCTVQTLLPRTAIMTGPLQGARADGAFHVSAAAVGSFCNRVGLTSTYDVPIRARRRTPLRVVEGGSRLEWSHRWAAGFVASGPIFE